MNTPPLLVELLTEELPPHSLRTLGAAFAKDLTRILRQDGFLSANSTYEFFATPRRLAARITEVLAEAHNSEILVKGPSVSSGLDTQGKPALALLGFAKKRGVAVEALERMHDGKQEVFVHRELAKGGVLRIQLGAKIQAALQDLPIPKLMSYQLADGKTTVKFARPAHRLVVLHGNDVVPCTVLGLTAGRVTEGHRSQSHVREITLDHAGEYEQKLETAGMVIASFDKRRTEIERRLHAQAEKLGAVLGAEKDVSLLLDEVTALVEWPAVYAGEFESEFLEVPQECLVLTMRTHQKYFPLFDGNGKLIHKFLIVSNLRLDDPQQIIAGNQRVVRPRLADARFFYETDKKTTLADRVPQLANIVYHNKLGSQLDRIQRIQKLASVIAEKLGADTGQVERAAYLCKADLLTHMVGEFPALQGVMGEYYALNDGEPRAVARAIREHYHPRFSNDGLPQDNIGASVALADKMDTLVRIFSIGQIPTGDKDPFALRRHSVGILRMLLELKLPLEISVLIELAAQQSPKLQKPVEIDVFDFMLERLRNYLRELGYSSLEIEAVVSQNPKRIDKLPTLLTHVRAYFARPEAKDLAEINKRVLNIIKKNREEIGWNLDSTPVNRELLKEKAEINLYAAIESVAPVLEQAFEKEEYGNYFDTLVTLKPVLSNFFDKGKGVLVMDPDKDLRINRAKLLQRLGQLMNRVADISKLAA